MVHMDAVRVSVFSDIYDVRLAFQLRAMWGDPAPLAEFCDQFIGDTLRAWDRARVRDGRAMAQALMPHWEREIHMRMERMEYEDRHRGYRGLRHDAMYFDEFGPAPWGKPEDPKAKQKARELLLRNLDDGQAKSFKKDGEFRVTAKDGKTYTIKTARSFNVFGPDGAKYCGQLVDTPIEDQMLAQKLLLEHDPDKFFKNANVSPAPGTREDDRIDAMRYMMMNAPRITDGPWNI